MRTTKLCILTCTGLLNVFFATAMEKPPRELQRLNEKHKALQWISIIEKARYCCLYQNYDPEIESFFKDLFNRRDYGLFVAETHNVITAQVNRCCNLIDTEKISIIDTLKNYCTLVFTNDKLNYCHKETARLELMQKELHDKIKYPQSETPS